MTLLAVLDVNTLASGAASGAGLPGQVVDLATDGWIDVAVSDQFLVKLDEVVQRPYFWKRLSEQDREHFIESCRAVARKKEPDPSVNRRPSIRSRRTRFLRPVTMT